MPQKDRQPRKSGHIFRLCLSILLFLSYPLVSLAGQHERISIIAPDRLMTSPVSRLAVQDVIGLLHRGIQGSQVTLNDRNARVRIILNETEEVRPTSLTRHAGHKPYPLLPSPRQDYR